MLKLNKIEPERIPTLRDRVKFLCAERGMKLGAVEHFFLMASKTSISKISNA